MSGIEFVLRQLRHQQARALWTIVAVALVVFCFLLLQTIEAAWDSAREERRDDRIAVWNRTTYALNLPKSYADRIARIDGVRQTSYASFVEGADPDSPVQNQSPAILAVDPKTYFVVYPESNLPDDQLRAWQADPHGAVVSKKIADLYGYKIGDRMRLIGRNYPGTWQLTIRGIYNSNYRTFADNLFIFHWDYLQSKLTGDDPRRGEISWLMALVDRGRSLDIAKDVDAHFRAEKTQTQSMTERNMVGLFMANFAGLLTALDIIGAMLVITMALLLFNLMTTRVRSRRFEFGVLRAIGFRRSQVRRLILGEAALIGFAGGAAGLLLSIWLVDTMIGAQVVEQMGALFPFFSVPAPAMIAALLLPTAVAVLASTFGARQAAELEITSLLKEIE